MRGRLHCSVTASWLCFASPLLLRNVFLDAASLAAAARPHPGGEITQPDSFTTRFIAIANGRRKAAVLDRGYKYARRAGGPDGIIWSADQPNCLRTISSDGDGPTTLEVLHRKVIPYQGNPPYGLRCLELLRIGLELATSAGAGTGTAQRRLLVLLTRLAPADDGSITGTELVCGFGAAEGRGKGARRRGLAGGEEAALESMGGTRATSKIRSSVRLLRQRTRPPQMQLESGGADAADDESIVAASARLAAYDAGHRAAAASADARGFGGALTANEWAASADYEPLASAVRVLWRAAARARPQDGQPVGIADARVILGICAEDAMDGVAALKAWVTALGLPKGPLHGMDREGVPLDMSTFGSVYIKYNSLPPPAGGLTDPPGTARLSGYNGDFRGVCALLHPPSADPARHRDTRGDLRQPPATRCDRRAATATDARRLRRRAAARVPLHSTRRISHAPSPCDRACVRSPCADVNVNLADGIFRQYAVLPLDLFSGAAPVEFGANSGDRAAVAAAAAAGRMTEQRAVSDASAGSNAREGRSVGQQRKAASGALNAANMRSLLQDLPEFAGLAPLGIAVSVREVSAEQGRVVLYYEGPANLRRAVEFNLATALRDADARVLKVVVECAADVDTPQL